MEQVTTIQFIEPKSAEELHEAVQRFEEKWQRRRRAHRIVGFAL